ncbi:hypothetical protein MKK75_24795 [Methylobacterium sp. J-030]|uniref:hypothetical protein n=1 Tax=Methylobacterium sp. J-030 TaxID=2836627 RepID=UPI001FBA103A|nr:hypothetical protein [Methylobacterium sp. J-030]MCJ2071981.1 hypothetical protein [Methylobacterium sp. J-030]
MFGSDGSPIVQYVVIFAVIFTALAAIVFTVRRLTGRTPALPSRNGSRGRQPRLGIVDVYELDRARQLILLRRDNVEHLLLVGGPNDVVVERNIQRGQRPLTEASLRADAAPDALDEPLPDPLVQGGRLPEPPRALPEMAGLRTEPLFDPGFEMPVIVPSPIPRSGGGPSVSLPLDPTLLGGDEPGQDISAPLSPPPAPKTTAPVREPVAPRRVLSRTAPPLIDPRPEPASERAPDPAPAADQTARQAPSLTVPVERRTVDPAILSDMARQLQAALSRPTSAVTPAPSPAASPVPAEGGDPVAAAPPAPVTQAEPVPPSPAPTIEAAVRPTAPVAPPFVQPAPPYPEAPRASHSPAPPAPKALPAFRPPPPEPSSAARSDAKSTGNPFSVEEIEAEFARLLGRPLDKRS